MMVFKRAIGMFIASLFCAVTSFSQTVSVSSELEKMISVDHFWETQEYTTYQYSGFNRKGNNPDDVNSLYKEGKWHVYADCEGPGVATRIWSTFRLNRGWGNMKVEVDGKTIYEGPTKGFFESGLPFAAPMSQIEVRSAEEGKIFGICRVPMPFTKRFRFMLDKPNYNIVNIKRFDSPVAIKSFTTNFTNEEKAAWEKANNAFADKNFMANKVKRYRKVSKKANLNPNGDVEIKLDGSGIIRGIELDADKETLKNLQMKIFWDGESRPSVDVPVELGFGSNEQSTLLLGANKSGKYNYIPMPFQKNARISIHNNSSRKLKFKVSIFREKADVANAVKKLRAKANSGKYYIKSSQPPYPKAPLNEYFYKNGFTVLDTHGAGHVIAYLDYFDCQPELDEHIFVDEKNNFPNNLWNGTGHEDLFDMSWGHFNKSSAYVSGGSEHAKEVNTRIFWESPITYKKSLKFNWEWTPNIYKNPNRDAGFSTVIYYYQ
ncbi:hypothetical protein FUAX_31890 [Fulvitalea axinellae]|uniref:DUF2961 domain-containing protein n=1 Tax=Fulvitalea axinellae TaxID=1182444 RepID=A0AAU9CUS4_9BACT|nr:hypothetical protein FUAX_31890 [Fulvitalea axinellae]